MKKVCLALICGLTMSAAAHAKRPSYSHFDAAYLQESSDQNAGEGDGFRLGLDLSMNRWLYFTGGYDRAESDTSDATSSAGSAGFGIHTLSSKFQLFAAGTYETANGDDDDSDDEGYGVQLGARLPFDLVELQADYKYFNYGEVADGTRKDEDRYRFSALAHLTRRFALTGSYEAFEQAKDVDQWTVGVRVYFDNRHDLPRRKKRGPTPPPPPEDSVEQDAEAQ